MRHWAEEVARRYLEGLGLTLLAHNYPVKGGEIDLIMRDGDETVFVEVRQRARLTHGTPAETLDPRKLARIRRAARTFLLRNFGRDDVPARIDAVFLTGNRERHRLDHLPGIG